MNVRLEGGVSDQTEDKWTILGGDGRESNGFHRTKRGKAATQEGKKVYRKGRKNELGFVGAGLKPALLAFNFNP